MIDINKVLKQINKDVVLFAKITPNSKKNQILEIVEYDTKFYLKIKIKELALENKANKALIEYISKILHIPKSSTCIESGTNQSYKSIKIKSLSVNDVQKELLNHIKGE